MLWQKNHTSMCHEILQKTAICIPARNRLINCGGLMYKVKYPSASGIYCVDIIAWRHWFLQQLNFYQFPAMQKSRPTNFPGTLSIRYPAHSIFLYAFSALIKKIPAFFLPNKSAPTPSWKISHTKSLARQW